MPLRIKRIYGNTWCLRTPLALLPFYKLNEREIVLIDSGSDQDGSVAEYFAGLDLKVRTLLLTHALPVSSKDAVYQRPCFGQRKQTKATGKGFFLLRCRA